MAVNGCAQHALECLAETLHRAGLSSGEMMRQAVERCAAALNSTAGALQKEADQLTGKGGASEQAEGDDNATAGPQALRLTEEAGALRCLFTLLPDSPNGTPTAHETDGDQENEEGVEWLFDAKGPMEEVIWASSLEDSWLSSFDGNEQPELHAHSPGVDPFSQRGTYLLSCASNGDQSELRPLSEDFVSDDGHRGEHVDESTGDGESTSEFELEPYCYSDDETTSTTSGI